ncbi:MAG: rhodanese-like domain-containing protein [Thermoleophilia bacterium]
MQFVRNIWAGVAGPGVAEVDTVEAARLIDQQNAVVIDVRTEAEYAAGRIPNARHVSLRQLPAQIAGLEKYKDRPIVVSCRTGSRSRSAVAYLAENGFEEVYNLKGGLIAWARARQTIEN